MAYWVLLSDGDWFELSGELLDELRAMYVDADDHLQRLVNWAAMPGNASKRWTRRGAPTAIRRCLAHPKRGARPRYRTPAGVPVEVKEAARIYDQEKTALAKCRANLARDKAVAECLAKLKAGKATA